MRAMVLSSPKTPLLLTDVAEPVPAAGQVLIAVSACGVCRTDLHVLDGELPDPKPRLVPGHQIVGRVVGAGPGATRFAVGARVGVPWLGWTCGACRYCTTARENLCDRARYTGYHLDGGYADRCVADERYVFPLPEGVTDVAAAPLLCAGLIGYRSWKLLLDLAPRAEAIGLYGFGAAAHLLIQVARAERRAVYAFTRPGDDEAQAFARSLGAVWAGGSDEKPPVELGGAILFAPVGALVPAALAAVEKGGVVVCGGIHMSDVPSFPYALLWGERVVRSVANLTRQDGDEFLALAARLRLHTDVTTFPLAQTNEALAALRHGAFQGAAVVDLSAK